MAVIDVERILIESERGKAALQELDGLRQQKQQEGETRQEEINELRNRLSEGQLSLSQERLAELQKQLEDRVIALRRFQDDANRELGKKRDEILAQIEQSVFPVINQIGEEGGYTLIFNKYNSGLVYAQEAVDITRQVIERYNQSAPGRRVRPWPAPASPSPSSPSASAAGSWATPDAGSRAWRAWARRRRTTSPS